MDNPFNYGTPVTGKYFIGRKKDQDILENLISNNENIVISAPPKSGKSSLIRQTFLNMKVSKKLFLTGEIDMRFIRDGSELVRKIGDSVIRCFASTPQEFREIISKWLSGTHIVFDQRNYADSDSILSQNWELDEKDIRAILRLPYNLSRENDRQTILILKEFQCIMQIDNGERIIRLMEEVIKEQRSMIEPSGFSFIMTGSQTNAMKDIFKFHGHFHRLVEHLQLSSIDDNTITEYVVRGFLAGGKVAERELLKGACTLFRGEIWYINHFFSVCDHLSKGYINESILIEALACIISSHEPRFEATLNSLTNFQVNLLKAILEGHSKFSSSEVIRDYNLSSSANVKRLKDALSKKEIVSFDDDDNATVIDPLFEYWLKKYLFKKFEI